MKRKNHWERIYATKSADEVSWYQANPERSLRFIRATGVPLSAAILDVGGGASRLVDALLKEGYANLSVLDISATALDAAKGRLGSRASAVQWLRADVTRASLPPAAYDVWHDRAVFHFLTSAVDRNAYVETACRSVKAGGHVIIAAFSQDGPTQCSALPVMRYSAEGLHEAFGQAFTPLANELEAHRTPGGAIQHFVYCRFRRA